MYNYYFCGINIERIQFKNVSIVLMKSFSKILFLFIIFAPSILFAQNPKKYYKTAEEFIASNRYKDAIDLLTKAIDIEPDNEEIYLLRASAYELIEDYRNAVEDYKRASVFMGKESDVFYKAGMAYYKLKRYNEALEMTNQALELKKSNLEALQLKVLVLIELEDYFNALQAAEDAVKIKSSAQNFYFQGLVSEKLKNERGAVFDYERALKKDKDFVPAYIALSKLALDRNEIKNALNNIEQALIRESENVEAILVRSNIYKVNHDYSNAITDLSEAILIDYNNPELYFARGNLYVDLKQYQNAIYDFSQVIKFNGNYIDAYYQRGLCNEQIRNKQSAIEDYKKLVDLSEKEAVDIKNVLDAQKRLFELRRENNKPGLILQEPLFQKGIIEIPQRTAEIKIRGRVSDESEINFLKINNDDVTIVEDIDGLGFDYNLYLGEENTISIILGDVYNNILQETFQVIRTEVIPPSISVLAPYASENGDVYLSDSSSTINIEGVVTDESTISSIIIEGISASYRLDDINPTFTATINIANKNKFKITAIDKFGNETVEVYRITREVDDVLSTNPMGKTWVVFIENSDYQNFPKQENVSKEIELIQNSLASYSILNFLHKKDYSKHDLERFFAIELRDLIRSNKVNSLIVVYAGKSEFSDGKVYWLPYDAREDEKFSYFNINALKASLQGYTNYLTHILVITNVCNLGSQFYQLNEKQNSTFPDCNDSEKTTNKSAQVLGLSTEDKSPDGMLFSQAFSKVLEENKNRCLSIEEVQSEISKILKSDLNENVVLGDILGLENENGTFFFISKKNKGMVSQGK